MRLRRDKHGDDADPDPHDLFVQGREVFARAVKVGDARTLDRAVELLERALSIAPFSHPERPSYLNTLGLALWARSRRTGTTADLDRAVELYEEALATTSVEHRDRRAFLTTLAEVLRERFEHTGAAADLDRAINFFEESLAGAPVDDPSHTPLLPALQIALWTRFQRTGSSEDLDRAITVGEAAAAATPLDDPDRLSLLDSLGLALATRSKRTGSPGDFDRLIIIAEATLAATPPHHPGRPGYMSNLASVVRTRFERTNTMADLDRLITIAEATVATTAPDHFERQGHVSDLAYLLGLRFERIESADDLNRAIELYEQVVPGTPADHPERQRRVANLGSLLRRRFERTDSPDDLNRAIDLVENALAATPPNHTDRPRRLSSLGRALEDRFKLTGRMSDLDRAIEVFEEALAATAVDHAKLLGRLSDLAGALRDRFERTGSLSDLDRAITLGEQTLVATAADHPDGSGRAATVGRPGHLSNLGIALQMRFLRTGRMADLDQAITVVEEAVRETPPDHPARSARLSNLGIALHNRFERTGRVVDLDRAIELDEQATVAAAPDDPSRPRNMSNLGIALSSRFHRIGEVADLDRAIDVFEEALAAIGADDPDRATYLSNLCNALTTRVDRTMNAADRDRAIDLGEQAVAATPTDHPDRPGRLSSLAGALWNRSKRTGSIDDFNKVIDLSEQAVAATAEDHAERSALLSNLGNALESRFERTGNIADLHRGIGVFRAASAMVSGPVDVRAHAARRWGQMAVAASDWGEAIEGFSAAVQLAGLAVPRELGRADQEFRLAELVGLGSEAAAVCLQAGDRMRGRAVELFEQGRAIMFSQVLDSRSDLTDLRRIRPELAEQYTRCRDVLDRPDPSGPSIGDTDAVTAARLDADARRAASVEFKQVLTEIRRLPGFERFLTPRELNELIPAAAEGPVVLVNVAQLRSDALIITTEGVAVVRLPGVDPNEVIAQANAFLGAVSQLNSERASRLARGAAAQVLDGVLGWLGDRITGPVLDHLCYTNTPADDEQWPRVWWCPAGVLALLPLHAAGHHASDGPSDAVIDRVISSTVPTLRALIHARQNPFPESDPRMLVVAMPRDLPGAAEEAANLQRLWPAQVTVLGLPPDTRPATHHTVITQLPHHRWVHFSCHGHSVLSDPSTSHLLLHDRPLTVLDLTHTRLPDAELAFLSACTTARSGAKLPDEPIHLAAACQLAGYRDVIASLWPIADDLTAKLTENFYTRLKTNRQNSTETATALHHAIRYLRDTHPHPHLWAPYTHTGP